MKDLFKEFNKYTARKHLAVGVSALVFALGINALLLKTDTGVRLQTSAVEFAGGKTSTNSGADLALVKGAEKSDTIHFRLGKKAEKVMEIQATLITDPINIEIKNLLPIDADMDISKISNIDGVTFIMAKFKTPRTIEANATIFSAVLKKKKNEETPLNLASTRLIADGNSYDLTNQGIIY